MPISPVPDALIAAVQARRGLHELPGELDAPCSPYIRRVCDPDDRTWILKLGSTEAFKRNEGRVMRKFRKQGVRAPKVKVLSDDRQLMLVRDLGGQNLAQAARHDPKLTLQAASLARKIHRLRPPGWLIDTDEFLRVRYLPRLGVDVDDHDPRRREAARRALPVLGELQRASHERRFLHGDFHPYNIVVAGGKLWAIDPFGVCGDRAYDLAALAAHSHDPIRTARRLQKRYGQRLRRLDRWLALTCYAAVDYLLVRGEDPSEALRALRSLT